MSTEDRFVLDLGTEAGPLDSPLTAPLEGGALELASLRPASRNRPVNEGRSIEIEGESAPPGPSLELALDASDPEASRLRGVIEKKKPAVAAGPRSSSAGERDAAKGEPVSATRPRTNARPASTAIDPNAVPRDLDPARPRPRPASSAVDPNAVPARDLDPARPRPRPAPSAIDPDAAPAHDLDPARPRPRPAASAVDPNAGPPRNVDPARVSDLHLKAAPADETGARVRPGRASADPDLKAAQAPSATHIADARANHAAGPGRPSATSLPDGRVNRGRAPIRPTLGFWDAAMLGFSGTSVSWIAKIGGATVVLAGLAQLSMLLPGVGVPLLLIGLTCLLGLCSEYHRHVFWAAATRERELNERPALSVVNMMRDGFHLAALAVVSQALLWFWLAGQLQAGHRPIAIVFSPTLWVLGFGPGFYWPIALACAAAQNQATGVWNFARGFRALGRAPGAIAAVVLTTAVAFMLSWMVMAAVISPTALDPTCALVTAAGLPIAISHALAGALMGRAVHERPQLFE